MSRLPHYQRAIIPKFLRALGLSDKDKITINVVDKKTKRGMKREVEVSKLKEDRFLGFLRAQNFKKKEIFLLLPKNYLVLDDREGPLQGACNIETSPDSWHNILRFDREVDSETARAIKLKFGSDPSAKCGTRLPCFFNKKRVEEENEEQEEREEVENKDEAETEEGTEAQKQEEDEQKRQGFLVKWDGSEAVTIDLDKFLEKYNIKVERKPERKPPAQGRKKRRVRFRRFEPDWSSLYQEYLLRNGGDYSRADFSLALRLVHFQVPFYEAVDVLRNVSLSFRPRERQQKSRTYWEHTLSKAEQEYRKWEASYRSRNNYSFDEEENSPAWREPGR